MIRFSIHQTGKVLFAAESVYGKTDKNGNFQFIWNDVVPGYFTLISAPVKSDTFPQVYADVVTVKVK